MINFRTPELVKLRNLWIFMLAILSQLPFAAKAFDEGDVRAGISAGQVFLLGDVGSRVGSGLGFGAFASYAATPTMLFDVSYLQSNHSQATHSELSLGVDSYLGGYDSLYPQVLGGVSFFSATNQDPTNLTNLNSTAFGLYAGAAMDFEVSPKLSVGLQIRYEFVFETSVKLSNGNTIKAIQDDATILLRLSYDFSSLGKH